MDNSSGHDILLVFILCFNYDIKHKETPLDSTQSRDQPIDLETDHQILPESPAPTTEIIRGIRQIHFQQNSHIDEIPITATRAWLVTSVVTSLHHKRTLHHGF